MIIRSLIATIILASLFLAACDETPKTEDQLDQKARAAINEFISGKYDLMATRFDSTMTANVPVDQLEELWNSLTMQCGQFKSIGRSEPASIDNYDIIYVELIFEDIPYWAKILYNKSGRLAGLQFTPDLPTTEWTIANYANPDKFVERGGTLGDTAWGVPAIITLPLRKGPHPAVVLVHRHGPYDKDETIGACKPFEDLALGLATQNIAVLRYDKLTFVHPDKFAAESDFGVSEEVVAMVNNAVALLRASPEIDSTRIFMLGHGFGGTLAPKIAEQTNYFAGYILMGSPAKPLEDVLVNEIEYLYSEDGNISPSEQNIIDKLKGQADMVKNPELTESVPAEYMPLGLNAGYWLDLRSYDPIDLALKMTEPMLILQGGRDHHSSMSDFELWRQLVLARDNVQLRSFPALNHLFIRGAGRSNPQEFLTAGHVDREVINYIAEWVEAH